MPQSPCLSRVCSNTTENEPPFCNDCLLKLYDRIMAENQRDRDETKLRLEALELKTSNAVNSYPTLCHHIDAFIAQTVEGLGPIGLKYIRYTINDEPETRFNSPGIYFRIVISDAAAKTMYAALRNHNLSNISRAVNDAINRTGTAWQDMGIQTMVNFRSESEQQQIKDPEWE